MKRIEFKKKWVSHAAHELKSPLVSLRGYLDLLTEYLQATDLVTDKKIQNALLKLDLSVERMNRLAAILTELASIYENTFQLFPENFQLQELINELDEEFEQIIKEKDIEFIREIPEIQIKADYARLRMILRELLANAVKYTPKNESVEFRVRLEDDKKKLIVEIRDSGKKINLSEVTSLLEPFSKGIGDTSKGTGLGLSIAFEVTKAHGGDFTFQNLPEKGNLVRLTFPQ